MDDLIAARLQMAFSLAFHIIFACVGIAMPFMMAVAHAMWLKTRKEVYLTLTKSWSKGVAIFFAIGAVSGTTLSFELGLLWPTFMEHAGGIIGMPFSWEGAAFFIEAIALGLFLYGWNRIPELLHWFCGLVVGISGAASAIFVVAANAWMNSPAGFDWVNEQAINIDPWAAMFNDAMLGMGIHMVLGAFQATGFAVGGIHAYLLTGRPGSVLHRKAMVIALAIGAIAALIQPLSGHDCAASVAERQPIKLAAMEGHFETTTHAPLLIGGIPDEEVGITRYALEVPGMLSYLAFGDVSAEVPGLNAYSRDLWPPVAVTHVAFQIMVTCGGLMALLGLWFFGLLWKGRGKVNNRLFLWLAAACAPLGMVAVWAGWTVTEVGRQPWIIYNIMRTADAVTPMPGLQYPFWAFMALYAGLLVTAAWLMKRQIQALDEIEIEKGW